MQIHFHLSSSTCRPESQQQQSRELGECFHLFSSCTLSFHGMSCHSSVYFVFLALQKFILAIPINRKTMWDNDSSFLSYHHECFKILHTSTFKTVNLLFTCKYICKFIHILVLLCLASSFCLFFRSCGRHELGTASGTAGAVQR